MPFPPIPTTLGALDGPSARALLDMLDHDGIVPLRRLMKARQTKALAILRRPDATIDRMKYEAGALDFILELNGILDGGLQEAYASAVELTRQSNSEPANDASNPRSRSRESEREDVAGPE